MRVSLSASAMGLAALALAGCTDQSRPLPQGLTRPSAEVVSSPTSCDTASLRGFASTYFSHSEDETEGTTVQNLLSLIESAVPFTVAARDTGFTVMGHIAANIAAGNTDSTDASSLTNGLLACMYSDTADLPATFPENFSVATDPAAHGAYAVRGRATDGDTVVFSRPLASPFSGIGPDSLDPLAPWAPMLSGDSAPRRILVYGVPGSSPQTFDWRVVPRRTVFSPPAIIGVCIDPDVSSNRTSLMHEQNVGLLPFVHAVWMNLSSCSPTSAARPVPAPLQLALGAARWGLNLFAPVPLSATNATIIDGLAGSTGGIHSEFGTERVDTVTLTFAVQPTDIHLGQIIAPPVVVQATHASTGSRVANVAVTLTAGPNNGVPAKLLGTLTQVTNAAGLAIFGDLSETKPGGYILNATGTVGGRPAIFVLRTSSTRFHVRP